MSRLRFQTIIRLDRGPVVSYASPHDFAKFRRRDDRNGVAWDRDNMRLREDGALLTRRQAEVVPVVEPIVIEPIVNEPIVIEPGWIPPNEEGLDPLTERARDDRLTLLQRLGEQMLAGASA